MTDRPRPEPRKPSQADFAPEVHNAEQEDEEAQAHTLAEEALGRASTGFGLTPSEKVGPSDEDGGLPDLVDHMRQMETSGRIDMSAFRGERNDDDNETLLGEQGRDDDYPLGAE